MQPSRDIGRVPQYVLEVFGFRLGSAIALSIDCGMQSVAATIGEAEVSCNRFARDGAARCVASHTPAVLGEHVEEVGRRAVTSS